MASVISDLRKPSHNVNARLGNKEGSHAVLKNKLMLQGAGEEMLEDAGMQSLADSVASTLREKIMCAMSLIKRCQEMTNKETGFSNQFNFFLQKKKLAFYSFTKIQGYFVLFLSPPGNVSVCVWVSVYSLPSYLSVFLTVCLSVWMFCCVYDDNQVLNNHWLIIRQLVTIIEKRGYVTTYYFSYKIYNWCIGEPHVQFCFRFNVDSSINLRAV